MIWYDANLAGKYCPCQKVKEVENDVEVKDEKEEKNAMSVFFETTLNNAVNKFKYPIMIVFFVWTIIATFFAT
jgi:hypothetical protein